jgi:hypothetical protein
LGLANHQRVAVRIPESEKGDAADAGDRAPGLCVGACEVVERRRQGAGPEDAVQLNGVLGTGMFASGAMLVSPAIARS